MYETFQSKTALTEQSRLLIAFFAVSLASEIPLRMPRSRRTQSEKHQTRFFSKTELLSVLVFLVWINYFD